MVVVVWFIAGMFMGMMATTLVLALVMGGARGEIKFTDIRSARDRGANALDGDS